MKILKLARLLLLSLGKVITRKKRKYRCEFFGLKAKCPLFQISVVTRDEVGAYKPYLWEHYTFNKGPMIREWILTKVSYFSDICDI